jgi:hypothetical protein
MGREKDSMGRIAMVVAAIALVAAACAGSDGEGVASLEGQGGSTTPSVSQQDRSDEAALLDFGACMRDNGVPEFPDPVFNADGSVDFGVTPGQEPFPEIDREVLTDAVAACVDELEGVAIGPGGIAFDLTEIQDRLVEFAACMRENGVDIDDPDLSELLSGDAAVTGPFGDLDLTDPDIQSAIEECRGVFTGLGFGE